MAAAIPVGIMAGKAIYGAIQKHKADKALKGAQAERQGMVRQASGVGNALQTSGTNLTDTGMKQGVNPALNYYNTLLGGNRAQMGLATAAPRAEITDQFRGAQRSLEHSGVRGAAGDQAKADLIRDRTAKIAGLTTGVQPNAAAALGTMGTAITGQGGQRLANAGQLWSNLTGYSQENQQDAAGRADTANAQFGSSLFDLISAGGKMATDKWGGAPAQSSVGPYSGGYRGPITGGGMPSPPGSIAQY